MPTESHLENIQHAQDTYRDLEERLEDVDEEAADTVRHRLEDAEDVFDDAPEEDGTLQDVRELTQSAQDAVNKLQASAPADLKDDLEAFEDQLETIEDGVVDDLLDEDEDDGDDDVEGYEVTVSGETKVLDQRTISPVDLLREFEYDPNQYVLYPPDEDERIPKGAELDLAERNEFDAIPADTAYGSTQLDEVLEGHIDDLRGGHEVDVDTEAEAQYTHVIIRDYPIPSEAYNKETTDVMIRVHQNYPQKAPDWVYVDEDLQLANGGQLQKAKTNQVRGWLALSWHINKLDGVQWKPYETDLRWYLDTIVSGRLRQGN